MCSKQPDIWGAADWPARLAKLSEKLDRAQQSLDALDGVIADGERDRLKQRIAQARAEAKKLEAVAAPDDLGGQFPPIWIDFLDGRRAD